MNETESQITAIQLLDKSYQIKCPVEKVQILQQIAHYLNEKMRLERDRKKSASSEELTVMAAIQVIYEVLDKMKDNDDYLDSINDRIENLRGQIEVTLAENAQIEL